MQLRVAISVFASAEREFAKYIRHFFVAVRDYRTDDLVRVVAQRVVHVDREVGVVPVELILMLVLPKLTSAASAVYSFTTVPAAEMVAAPFLPAWAQAAVVLSSREQDTNDLVIKRPEKE